MTLHVSITRLTEQEAAELKNSILDIVKEKYSNCPMTMQIYKKMVI